MRVLQAAAEAASKDTSRSGMLAELRKRMSQQRTLWGVAPPLMKDLGVLLNSALNEVQLLKHNTVKLYWVVCIASFRCYDSTMHAAHSTY
jgi:hypothetical protein